MHLANSHLQSSTYQRQNRHTKNHSDFSQSVIEERMKESVSTRRHSVQKKSSDNLSMVKWESRVLDLQRKVDTQTYQIQTMKAQTQHFMRVCEQQKQKLNNLNVEMIRQEYEQQINLLVQEKQKTAQLIYNLTEDYKEVQNEYQRALGSHKKGNDELTRLIQQALAQKEELLIEIGESDKSHLQNEEKIFQQEEHIDELRNIERKLFIALKEMQSIQSK